jgi:hypothetical protein
VARCVHACVRTKNIGVSSSQTQRVRRTVYPPPTHPYDDDDDNDNDNDGGDDDDENDAR